MVIVAPTLHRPNCERVEHGFELLAPRSIERFPSHASLVHFGRQFSFGKHPMNTVCFVSFLQGSVRLDDGQRELVWVAGLTRMKSLSHLM
jgi:hypothetical protein